MFPKNKRYVNKDNTSLDIAYCICCNRRATEKHHVKSKGSGGGDEEHNLMPLDRRCHTEIHSIGLNSFVIKYQKVHKWLLAMGWYYDNFRQKWMR